MMKPLIYKLRIQLGRLNPRLDPDYTKVLAFVAASNNDSISHLQRNFLMGYSRACRLMAAVHVEVDAVPRTRVKARKSVFIGGAGGD